MTQSGPEAHGLAGVQPQMAVCLSWVASWSRHWDGLSSELSATVAAAGFVTTNMNREAGQIAPVPPYGGSRARSRGRASSRAGGGALSNPVK
jgi:hypothetical protein